jgi:hypothetical protein
LQQQKELLLSFKLLNIKKPARAFFMSKINTCSSNYFTDS